MASNAGRKAEAEPGPGRRTAPVQPVKRLDRVLQFAFRYANTIIAHAQLRRAFTRADTHFDVHTRLIMPQGILYEIDQHLDDQLIDKA